MTGVDKSVLMRCSYAPPGLIHKHATRRIPNDYNHAGTLIEAMNENWTGVTRVSRPTIKENALVECQRKCIVYIGPPTWLKIIFPLLIKII